MSEVLDHLIKSIVPASITEATAAAQRLMRAELGDNDGLSALAARLCAARHSAHPNLNNKAVVVVGADHGIATANLSLGANNPTLIALQLMAEGGAAINTAARSADAKLVLVDAGIRGGEQLGGSILSFRIGDGTADFTETDAMSDDEARNAVQTGIALVFSLADPGLDLLAIGQVAAGAAQSSESLVAALLAEPKEEPLCILAKFGGFEIGVLTGLILGAASIKVPVILDGHGTSSAALLATHLSAHVAGYLFASHAGGISAHRQALDAIGISPLFAVGLAQGEGTGAVLAMPMLEAAARVVEELSLGS